MPLLRMLSCPVGIWMMPFLPCFVSLTSFVKVGFRLTGQFSLFMIFRLSMPSNHFFCSSFSTLNLMTMLSF